MYCVNRDFDYILLNTLLLIINKQFLIDIICVLF